MTTRISDFDAKGFESWLDEKGATILTPTNEYEIVRYRFGTDPIGLVYWKPTKRIWSLVGPASDHYQAWQAGTDVGAMTAMPPVDPPRRVEIKVYTDASLYGRTLTGAWGAIILMPDGTEHEFSGPLIGEVTSSTAAEMMAVANAVHRGIALRHIGPDAAIRVICDNSSVIGYLKAPTKKRRSRSPDAMKALAHLTGLARRYRLKIKPHWIKGHQPQKSKCPHAPFNRRCDKLAKGHAKALDHQRRIIEAENQEKNHDQ